MNTSPCAQTTAGQNPSTATATACSCRRRRRSRRITGTHHAKSDENQELVADEKAEVDKKIMALQKIVPGGERLPVEELFDETAKYIFALESQVEALRYVTAFVQTSEKRERKLGC